MRKFGCFVLLLCMLVGLMLPAAAADLDVAGKSALLMDAATGTVLYEKNAHEKLSPASVTKVMTLLLIMEAIDSGKIGWNDTVTASETAAAKGGSQIFLKVGETMSVTDLVKSIAVSSANDAACAMAEHIAGSETAFVSQMNDRAAQLGMADTHFVNCTGLDDSADAADHLTCAYDIAIMSRELMVNHPDITKFTTIWMDTVRNAKTDFPVLTCAVCESEDGMVCAVGARPALAECVRNLPDRPEEAAEMVAERLGRQGIAVRAGLHCAPLAHESAGTLKTGTVRVSFGHDAALRQVKALTRAL